MLGVSTNIDTRQIYPSSRLVSEITGFPVQPNKAIVGNNAFRHASGIHQDAVLKERTTFEIMEAQSVGWPSNSIVLGKLSGRSGLRSRLEEMGYVLSQDELNEVFADFKNLADRKREVTDADLEVLMSTRRRMEYEPSIYELERVQVSCGNHEIPTATVSLKDPDGSVMTDAATGTGPVDSVYKAINRIVGVPNTLTEFTVNAVTEGIDALGRVTIRIEKNGVIYVGRGSDVDIIVASAKAYMSALNRLLAKEGVQRAVAPSGTGRLAASREPLTQKQSAQEECERMPPRTMFEKVWDAHVIHEAPGEPALLYVDLHLVHEVTSLRHSTASGWPAGASGERT